MKRNDSNTLKKNHFHNINLYRSCPNISWQVRMTFFFDNFHIILVGIAELYVVQWMISARLANSFHFLRQENIKLYLDHHSLYISIQFSNFSYFGKFLSYLDVKIFTWCHFSTILFAIFSNRISTHHTWGLNRSNTKRIFIQTISGINLRESKKANISVAKSFQKFFPHFSRCVSFTKEQKFYNFNSR